MPLRRLVGDREGESSTLSSLALVHQHLGGYQRALSLLQEALRIQEALPDQDLSAILNNLATVWLNLGDMATSLHYHERVLEMKQERGSQIGQATTLNNMGLAYAQNGNYLSARDHYRRALKLWQIRRHKRGLASTLQNLALTEIRLKDLPAAMKHLLRAQRIQESIEDVPGLGITLNNIGLALSETSDPMRAIPYYVEAQALHATTSQWSEQTTTLVNHARLHWRLGHPDEARALLMQAIELDYEVDSSQTQEHLDLLEHWSATATSWGSHDSDAED